MKKYIILLIISVSFLNTVYSNPGDTTWVTIYNLRKITQWGNHDTSAVLPTGKTFRKIKLHYILGRYACPTGTQYCGSWDYTTQVYAKPANADTVELARIITPYATDWLNANRTHDFVVDVTDYSSILQGNLDFRYKYDGYSWGFTLTLKLEMIEGTPALPALSVKNIYDGYYIYGSTSNPIENKLIEKSYTYNFPATTAKVKNTISGHGADDNDCSEFCSKYYQLKINGNIESQKQLWKNDCGLNDISPQTGTWLYDRANWCPGQVVYPIMHDIGNVTSPANTFSVDVDFEPYTSPTQSNAGGYNVVSQLITYAAPSYSTDVSIEDIISPTTDPNYARSNTICTNPKIKIKNTGTLPLIEVVFNYGIVGSGSTLTYSWTGNLAFMKDTIVEFGNSISLYNGNTTNTFVVSVNKVNGNIGDQDLYNNTYSAVYNSVKVYPNKFIVLMYTNGSVSQTNSPYSETSWTIKDISGNIIASRLNNSTNVTLKDTVNLPDGCYTFTANDDGCDGLSWWAYQYYTPNPGSGYVRFNKIGTPVPLKTFTGDFGCQISERFMTSSLITSINENEKHLFVQLYPNPASNILTVKLTTNSPMVYSIKDITGKVVKQDVQTQINGSSFQIVVNDLANGLYFFETYLENDNSKRNVIKFSISK